MNEEIRKQLQATLSECGVDPALEKVRKGLRKILSEEGPTNKPQQSALDNPEELQNRLQKNWFNCGQEEVPEEMRQMAEAVRQEFVGIRNKKYDL